jgi:hypothetical protein
MQRLQDPAVELHRRQCRNQEGTLAVAAVDEVFPAAETARFDTNLCRRKTNDNTAGHNHL